MAFLSDRTSAGRMQAYVLEADRIGEAIALPEVEGTVEWLAWAPDGRRLLLGYAGMRADKPGASGSGTAAQANGVAGGLAGGFVATARVGSEAGSSAGPQTAVGGGQ